ncbi:MAG: hypothetical protein ACQETH_00570 [Candidatus Rifleibacteriota bacterium]
MNNRRKICVLVLTLIFFEFSLSASEIPGPKLRKNLRKGFFKAFATPSEFKATGIFDLLDYSKEEIAQIGKITPEPENLKIKYKKDVKNGAFKNIKVICSKVKYYNLNIATATFEFPDCELDKEELANNRIKFVKSDLIKLKTEVSQNNLLKVFELFARARSLKNLDLKLKKDRVRLDGRYRKGWLVVHFRVQGDVKLVNPKIVDFNCSRLTLNRIPMPRNARRSIISRINPVFNSSKTWLNLNIKEIKIFKGSVQTIATIDKKKG